MTGDLDVRHVADTAALVLRTPHGQSVYRRLGKPLLDRAGGLLLLVLALPLLAAVAVAVLLTLGRPVLITQPRVGRSGRVFRLYKFRTMLPDRRARAVAVPVDRRLVHKSPDDPRLRPVGRTLRAWSLDELPQLVNVVKGDMSLVGPRPELVSIVEGHYAPWQHARHAVKPGLTGLWQVTERGISRMHERTVTDLRYIESMCLRSDLGILLRTVPAALGRHRGT